MQLQNFDAIIIGAGMAGASAAWFLAPHARVLVLEREAWPGMHATGRSAALFSEIYGSAQVRALSRATRPFLEQPPSGFAAHPLFSPRGTLVIGTAKQSGQIHTMFETVAPHTRDLRLLDAAAVQAMVPVLKPEAAKSAVFEPGAADIDVNELHQGFLRGLREKGGRLLTGIDITSIERTQGTWEIECGETCFRAPLLLNAAGAWADEVARLAGVKPLGLQPRRRTAFLFEPPAGIDTARWPFVLDVGETFYFKPDAGLLLGSPANADDVHPHDVQPEDFDIALGIHRIEEATTLTIRRPIRSWAGLRSFVADGDLVGGFAPDTEGFFWIAAQGGYGIQTSAAMGESCAHLALGRSLPSHLQDAGISFALIAPRANGPSQ
jgi:D-arginine dehydrogenase